MKNEVFFIFILILLGRIIDKDFASKPWLITLRDNRTRQAQKPDVDFKNIVKGMPCVWNPNRYCINLDFSSIATVDDWSRSSKCVQSFSA